MANASRIQLRKDTAANWTSAAPTLANGELGLDTDSQTIRVGNGTNTWSTLPVAALGNTQYKLLTSQDSITTAVQAQLFPSTNFKFDSNSTYEIEISAVITSVGPASTGVTSGDGYLSFRFRDLANAASYIGGTGGVSRNYLTLVTSAPATVVTPGMIARVSGADIGNVTANDGAGTITLDTFVTVATGTTILFYCLAPTFVELTAESAPEVIVSGSTPAAGWTVYSSSGTPGTSGFGGTGKVTQVSLREFGVKSGMLVLASQTSTAVSQSVRWSLKVKGVITTSTTPINFWSPMIVWYNSTTITTYVQAYIEAGSYMKITELPTATTVGSGWY
jgi:hypothetical protein